MPLMEKTSGIAQYMRNLLQNYEKIRGKSKDSGYAAFWDIVVLTTGDPEQKRAFEVQLEDKWKRHELPVDLPIHVVVDPPGPKLGNGGSTLTVLSFLRTQYGNSFLNWRVLIVHAGGYSMRLPSATLLGKIFSPTPLGRPVYQMLDIKLALYWPMISRMPPGVFVACADDFEVYDLGMDKSWKFGDTGFTALAHPSNIEVGVTHGVYVLANQNDIDTTKVIQTCTCKEVLQKPTKEKMKNKKAIIECTSLMFPDNIEVQPPVVYTDSVFFFASDVSRKFLNFIDKFGAVKCEVDAYGDFLQALGPGATEDYIHNTSNISHKSSVLTNTRSKVFNLLKGTEITLLLMNASRFIHIGTTHEYIHHLCIDTQFRREMGFERDAFSTHLPDKEGGDKIKSSPGNLWDGCVMHSCLSERSTVNTDCVIEYCYFEVPIHAKKNNIISNCQVLKKESESLNGNLEIPGNLFLHTVSLIISGQTYYATVLYHIDDSLKKGVGVKESQNLIYLNSTLDKFQSLFNVDDQQIIPEGLDNDVITLWTAKLFPLKLNMSSSFETALLIAKSLQCGDSDLDLSECSLVSMADALKGKDIDDMLKFRNKLLKKIVASLHI